MFKQNDVKTRKVLRKVKKHFVTVSVSFGIIGAVSTVSVSAQEANPAVSQETQTTENPTLEDPTQVQEEQTSETPVIEDSIEIQEEQTTVETTTPEISTETQENQTTDAPTPETPIETQEVQSTNISAPETSAEDNTQSTTETTTGEASNTQTPTSEVEENNDSNLPTDNVDTYNTSNEPNPENETAETTQTAAPETTSQDTETGVTADTTPLSETTTQPEFNVNNEERVTTGANINLAANETFGSIEDTRQWRIENGNWHTLEASVTNHGDTPSEVGFMGYHHPGPITLWEGQATISPNSTENVQFRNLSVNASNDSYFAIENLSSNPITINNFRFANDGLPTDEETGAMLDELKQEELREAESGFRVLPYLQSPSSNSMTVNWISELNEPGTITISRNGNTSEQTSNPEYMEIFEYTLAELNQELQFDNGNGEMQSLPQGSWLENDQNYKHSVTFSNLQPNTAYNYVVNQGTDTYENTFTTFPEEEWDHIRLIAFSDTETEPKGALENREWAQHPINTYVEGSEERPSTDSLWAQLYGTDTRNGQTTVRYPLDQQTALNENLRWIQEANPDALLIAGDLTQGSGYQPAWDEFWRHFAGEFTDLASDTPLITSIGNWETTAVINGGYGSEADRSPVVTARNKYHAYMDTPGDPANPQHKDSYYRTDMGPITILTLDSTNGIPDETTANPTGENYTGDDRQINEAVWHTEGIQGDPYITTDTQGSFTAEEYDAAYAEMTGTSPEESDLPNFNPGTEQWNWAVEQLRDAREQGQIILVQFHHASYSSGVHGTAPNFEHQDNQAGTAMRVYSPLFEEYGVAAVIAGHDEMFERSWVDLNGDGQGFQVYDVGVAADGLRTEYLALDEETGEYYDVNFNTRSEWTATDDEPELWQYNDQGVLQLVDGGLHYGHLQIDLENLGSVAKMTLSPVYIFPILDNNYQLIRTERRVYDDVTVMYFNQDGQQIPESEALQLIGESQVPEETPTPPTQEDNQTAEETPTPTIPEVDNQIEDSLEAPGLEQERDQVVEEIVDLEDHLDDVEREYSSITDRIEELRNELNNPRADRDAIIDEIAELEFQLKNLANEHALTVEEISQLHDELDRIEKDSAIETNESDDVADFVEVSDSVDGDGVAESDSDADEDSFDSVDDIVDHIEEEKAAQDSNDAEGERLPDTATSTGLLGLAGLASLVTGTAASIFDKKKRK